MAYRMLSMVLVNTFEELFNSDPSIDIHAVGYREEPPSEDFEDSSELKILKENFQNKIIGVNEFRAGADQWLKDYAVYIALDGLENPKTKIVIDLALVGSGVNIPGCPSAASNNRVPLVAGKEGSSCRDEQQDSRRHNVFSHSNGQFHYGSLHPNNSGAHHTIVEPIVLSHVHHRVSDQMKLDPFHQSATKGSSILVFLNAKKMQWSFQRIQLALLAASLQFNSGPLVGISLSIEEDDAGVAFFQPHAQMIAERLECNNVHVFEELRNNKTALAMRVFMIKSEDPPLGCLLRRFGHLSLQDAPT